VKGRPLRNAQTPGDLRDLEPVEVSENHGAQPLGALGKEGDDAIEELQIASYR
jgi:hypothetical protein